MNISPDVSVLASLIRPVRRAGGNSYLVGGDIASMAAAAFMIRDGDILGKDITILDETDVIGGSLDGSGNPEQGYVLRGGRMLESKYLCTFGLFDSIPALEGGGTVTQEILAWNKTMPTSSKSRLFVDGHRETAPAFGLSEHHILTIERLALEPEAMLDDRASRSSSIRHSSRPISGSCGVRPSPSRPGTARSSSGAILFASRTWSAVSIA